MKKSTLYLAAFMAVSAVSCVSLSKVSTYPEPDVGLADKYLVQKEGAIDVSLEARLTPEYRNLNTGIRVEPVFDDGTHSMELPPFVIEGLLHKTFNRRMQIFKASRSDGVSLRKRYGKEGSEAHYMVEVPYNDWMSGAALYADLYADAYTREQFLGRIIIANGLLDLVCFTDFTPYMNYHTWSGTALGETTGWRKERSAVHQFAPDSVRFGFNSYHVELAKETEASFREHIRSVQAHPALKDYTVSVLVSNSPEGPLSYNATLGRQRLENLLKLVTEAGVPESMIETEVVDEEWDAILEALPRLGLANGDAIALLIRSVDDQDEREKEIRNSYPEDFAVISSEVYPGLRKGRITVRAKFEDAGEYRMSESTFSESDCMIGDIVIFDKDADGIVELNVRMLAEAGRGDMESARRTAELITNTSLPDAVKYNKALVFIDAGRLREAKSLLKGVTSIPEAAYNLGLLQLRDGEYDLAALNLDGFSDINSAIAHLYVAQNERAADILHLLEPSPRRDYLLAITYARLNRKEEAKRLLAGAVASSAELAEKAKREPDFISLDRDFKFRPEIK